MDGENSDDCVDSEGEKDGKDCADCAEDELNVEQERGSNNEGTANFTDGANGD